MSLPKPYKFKLVLAENYLKEEREKEWMEKEKRWMKKEKRRKEKKRLKKKSKPPKDRKMITIADFRDTLLANNPDDQEKAQLVEKFTECDFLWRNDTHTGITNFYHILYDPRKIISTYRTWFCYTYIHYFDAKSYSYSRKYLLKLFKC